MPRPDLEALFLANLPAIERIIGATARHFGPAGDDAKDFAGWVKLRLIENEYAFLAKFRGESSLSTYLTVVIPMLCREHRVREWGRWRPSAAAKRNGRLGIRLELLVYRDRTPLAAAGQLLRDSGRQATKLARPPLIRRYSCLVIPELQRQSYDTGPNDPGVRNRPSRLSNTPEAGSSVTKRREHAVESQALASALDHSAQWRYDMPLTIGDLDATFGETVRQVLDACAAQGITMRLNETVRSPLSQARIWRQSRTKEEIRARIEAFRAGGAPFLADCIERVGPQYGDHVTNAAPGLSWHQWGEALDCFWVVDGKAEWSPTRKVNGVNGFRVYAEAATGLGLDAGGFWKKLKDWPHIQLRAASSPLAVMSLPEIDREMKKRFSQE